jgi:hypothetical protein
MRNYSAPNGSRSQTCKGRRFKGWRSTQEDDLHSRVARIEKELEADLLLVEHEAKLVKNRIL